MHRRLRPWFFALASISILACGGAAPDSTAQSDASVCWVEVGRAQSSGVTADTRVRGQCVDPQTPRLDVSSDDPAWGQIPCRVLEVGTEPACDCAERGEGRHAVDPATLPADVASAGTCACEIEQLSGDALRACQSTGLDAGVDGWCYVSPAQGLGASELVAKCRPDQPQAVVFAGAGTPADHTTSFVLCAAPPSASSCSER